MKINTLISTMNQLNIEELLYSMNVKDDYVIINQITDNNIEKLPQEDKSGNICYSYRGRGLSKSRNEAISKSDADICVIADDDMYYENEYKETIEKAYNKYPDADIIAFVVGNEEKEKEKKIMKEGKVDFIRSMKISSVQITFKRNSIISNNMKFKEEFGAGAKYYFGEENIFLAECLKKGLKIYYVPKKIATLKKSESTWFKGHTRENYNISGAVYYNMSKVFYPILIVQFVLRKKWLYGKYMKPVQVMKYMFEGVKRYKKEKDENSILL